MGPAEWCRETAGQWTALELSGATWTLPTPPARTSCLLRGSPTTPGLTRPAPPQLQALPCAPPMLLLWLQPLQPMSMWSQSMSTSQWSQPMSMWSQSTPPTLTPSPTQLPPPLLVRVQPSRKYSEPTEDTIRRLLGSLDKEMLQARLIFPD